MTIQETNPREIPREMQESKSESEKIQAKQASVKVRSIPLYPEEIEVRYSTSSEYSETLPVPHHQDEIDKL